MRKLATIDKILKIEPIPGADAIEVAQVRGWKVVVKKDTLKAGDLCLYMEVDSFLPVGDGRYEFLRDRCYKKMVDGSEGFRIKTLKLRGQVSQGLILPIEAFKEEIPDPKEGEDVTEKLGIKLYEAGSPVDFSGDARSNFPTQFCVRTDESRIQNSLDFFEKYKDLEFVALIKIDGSSFSAIYNNLPDFHICSHNISKKESESNSFWRIANVYDLKNRMTKYARNLAVQGELFGEGIQKNREKVIGQDMLVFNIFDTDNYRYFTYDQQMEILNDLNKDYPEERKLCYVPVVYRGKIFQDYPTIESLLAFADGKSYRGDIREGIVCKSTSYVDGQIVSFKVINNKYLLKNED